MSRSPSVFFSADELVQAYRTIHNVRVGQAGPSLKVASRLRELY
jgi:hypothetical protein